MPTHFLCTKKVERMVMFQPVISKEKRLFYVALSRAKQALVIITQRGNGSPFLNRLNLESI